MKWIINSFKVKEWKYSERDCEGRQLFNKKYLEVGQQHSHAGDTFIIHQFNILPEDLE